MSSVFRRPATLGIWLIGCCLGLALSGTAHAQWAKSSTKAPAAKASPAGGTSVKGKVLTFDQNVLTLTNGKKYRLDPAKSKVLTRRGNTPATLWKGTIAPGDDVVVSQDARTGAVLSVTVAPPYQLPNGEYEVLGQTTYVYSDPRNPNAEGKEIPLLWVKSTDPKQKLRYVVELRDDTTLSGEGIAESVQGGAAIKQALLPNSIVRLQMSTALPVVDKYGDVESPTPLNGVVKAIRVIRAPAAGG